MNRCIRVIGAVFISFFLMSGPLYAQGLADTFSGFSSNSDEPINIEADKLDVDDKNKIAVFSGNVHVTQGDVTLRTNELHVEYVGEQEGSTAQEQQIRRLEARGALVVTQLENTMTGDWAMVEMAEELVTVGGDVVVSQGGNVVRGAKLII
ncbi:MAG: hypothetical protein K8F25_05745, partial [Fimbriimonadaceae bacterium]|nr:hypothetical protein [Alphaproteobacteria bacterium]